MRTAAAMLCVALFASAFVTAAAAQATGTDVFSDGKDNARIHNASGFVCPYTFGTFVRDAASETNPERRTVSCDYSTLDGVYGSVRLVPISGSYDPKASMAPLFEVQQATGGKVVKEETTKAGTLPVYIRIYQTAKLEDLKYSVLFSGAAVRNWAVETTIEYADPRDNPEKNAFFKAVYDAALAEIGKK